ncbi:Energy-coupling factor transporter transmembrane protein EcfT [compost metagenome]
MTAAAGLIILLLLPLRSLIYPWARLIRAYVILIGILCLIGALSVNPLSFEWEKALPIFIRFGKLLLIMLLGMPMLRLMSPMRLQRAVEQALGWLTRLRVPIHSFALLITLIFRFIPLLLREWERFAKLAHARGKATTPLRAVPVRMIRSVLIPYMRSILRLAEQLADALEARGYGYTKRRPTFGFRLRFGSNDARLLLTGAAVSLALILSAILL